MILRYGVIMGTFLFLPFPLDHGAGHYYYYAAIGNPQNHVASSRMQPMTKPAQPYQHLDCVALVNKALQVRSSKWFAQVHNTLAVAGLKLTTFVL